MELISPRPLMFCLGYMLGCVVGMYLVRQEPVGIKTFVAVVGLGYLTAIIFCYFARKHNKTKNLTDNGRKIP